MLFLNYAKIFLLFAIFLRCSQMHAKSISEMSDYPAFCELASKDEKAFENFKRHPSYQQSLEHISYELGQKYLEIIVSEYPELVSHFDRFRENDSLGNPITHYYENAGRFSPTTLRYIKVAGDLIARFGNLSDKHIVEIGGGYGGQCKILSDLCGFASYTLIDLPEANALSKKYLKTLGVPNVFHIDSTTLPEASQYDLVISNYAFSELDRSEQYSYLTKIMRGASNGYMTLNFISHHFNLASLSSEEITRVFLDFGKKGKIEIENPSSYPNNCLFTWNEKKPRMKILTKQASFIPSEKDPAVNAITYSFSGGALGDNLVAYSHAKWISYKHGLPLLYKEFPYSSFFSLEDRELPFDSNFPFQETAIVSKEEDIQIAPCSKLYICPYFPESKNEHLWCHFASKRLFEVDWDDEGFRQELIKCLTPKTPVATLNVPKEIDTITVAVHIRRSKEANSYFTIFPLKFVGDAFYMEQISRIAKIFPEKKILVHLFTDDENPWAIAAKYTSTLNNPQITIDCRSTINNGFLLEDFYSFLKFDCFIHPESNFSIMAAKLGKHFIRISPVQANIINGIPFIEEVELVFNGIQK